MSFYMYRGREAEPKECEWCGDVGYQYVLERTSVGGARYVQRACKCEKFRDEQIEMFDPLKIPEVENPDNIKDLGTF